MGKWRKRIRMFFLGNDGPDKATNPAAKPPQARKKTAADKAPALEVGFSGQAYLLKNGTTSLEVIFITGSEASIDKLFLEIENQRFQPLDFKPMKVKGTHRQFNLVDLRRILESVRENSLKRAAFIAISGIKEYRSPLFDISTLIM